MFNGSGIPAFVYGGTIYELPRPVQEGRDTNYIPTQEPYENIDGDLVFVEPRAWRYEAELEFSNLSNVIINKLIEIYNKGTSMKFVPHIDVPQVAYMVIIKEAAPSDEVAKDGFKLAIRSQKLITKIPTLDNMITCFQVNHVIIYNGE